MNIKKTLMILSVGLSLAATAGAADFSFSLLTGYQGGLSFRGGAGVSDFAKGFPLGLDFGLTYSVVDPGDPLAARRVFINNNTNGTPEESGSTVDFRLDFSYPFKVLGPHISIVAGPRFALFNGHFRYVGANEAFTVTSNQWGLGLGLKGGFPINKSLSLVIMAGLDYYLPGSLHGHDTTYAPDNVNVNPRQNYQYNDAAAAINAPALQPAIMIGLGF